MAKKRFSLVATIGTASPDKVETILKKRVGREGVSRIEGGFKVSAMLEGETARDLNRDLLSALRKVERKTTLRAEWTCGKTTERFFDYVPKG